MMNRLTIKYAARQAQGMGISHPFIEAKKKKPDEGIQVQCISCAISREKLQTQQNLNPREHSRYW